MTTAIDNETGRSTWDGVRAEYQEVMIDSPRREADGLVASAVGDSSHIGKLRRRRAETLRTGATKAEKFIAMMERLRAGEPEPEGGW